MWKSDLVCVITYLAYLSSCVKSVILCFLLIYKNNKKGYKNSVPLQV